MNKGELTNRLTNTNSNDRERVVKLSNCFRLERINPDEVEVRGVDGCMIHATEVEDLMGEVPTREEMEKIIGELEEGALEMVDRMGRSAIGHDRAVKEKELQGLSEKGSDRNAGFNRERIGLNDFGDLEALKVRRSPKMPRSVGRQAGASETDRLRLQISQIKADNDCDNGLGGISAGAGKPLGDKINDETGLDAIGTIELADKQARKLKKKQVKKMMAAREQLNRQHRKFLEKKG